MHAYSHKRGRPAIGFTLIELLVVLALILLLSSILFPCYSQARAQARSRSCLCSQKQVALSLLMYSQDYDETLPPWANGTLNAMTLARNCTIGSWQNLCYWTQLILPYMQNERIFTCPENSHSRDSDYLQVLGYAADTTGLQLEHSRACFSDFGYNQAYLSPRDTASTFHGARLAEVGQPSATLLGADSSASAPYANTAVGLNYVDAPTIAKWTTLGSDLWYGNVAPRHCRHANVAFADGHAKSLTIAALLQGYDPANAAITDPNAYLWDLR